jgi:hypothetical protein
MMMYVFSFFSLLLPKSQHKNEKSIVGKKKRMDSKAEENKVQSLKLFFAQNLLTFSGYYFMFDTTTNHDVQYRTPHAVLRSSTKF